MNIQVKTLYSQPALTAMARGLRKTVRRKRSRRSHVLGFGLTALALLLGAVDLLTEPSWVGGVDLALAALLLAVLLTEDWINGFLAGRKMMPGSRESETVFTDADYVTTVQTAQTRWTYEGVRAIAEGRDYLVLALGPRHAQVFDKRGIAGGEEEALCSLLREKTGLPITNM